jgi:hypothetical protein
MTTTAAKKSRKNPLEASKKADTHTNLTIALSDFELIKHVQDLCAEVDTPVTMTGAVRLSLRFFKFAQNLGYFDDVELFQFIKENKRA